MYHFDKVVNKQTKKATNVKQKFDIYTIKNRQTDLICQNLEVWNFQHISQCWAQQPVKANHITYLSFEKTMQPLCFMAPLFPYTNLLKMSLIQKMLISDYFHYDIFTNALLTKNQEKCA